MTTTTPTTTTTTPPPRGLSITKRVVLFTMIAAYGVAALAGIVAIVSGDPDWRVIGTTSIVGSLSLVTLASLSVVALRLWNLLGIGAIAAAVVATVSTLALIWGWFQTDGLGNSPLQTASVHTSVLAWLYACTLMFASLIVAAAQRAGRMSLVIASATTAVNVLSAGLATYLYFYYTSYRGPDTPSASAVEALARFTGAIAILGSLGVIVSLTVSLIQRASGRRDLPPAPMPVPDTAQLIQLSAARRGLDPDGYVRWLLTLDPESAVHAQGGEPHAQGGEPHAPGESAPPESHTP